MWLQEQLYLPTADTTTKAIQQYTNNNIITATKADLAEMVALVQQTINSI